MAAAASFAWQMRFREKKGNWAADFAAVGLMLGFIVVGVLALVALPTPDVVVSLVWGYSPHAYNLIIWPILALFILRPRFGPLGFVLAFIFAYGLDELIWNSIAFVRFGGNAGLLGFTTVYWHVFFAAVIGGVAVSYYLLRPRVVPNWTWGFFAAFIFVYAVVAGLPTYVDEPLSSYWYAVTWELMWQGAVWVLIYGTLWRRSPVGVGYIGE